MILVIWEIAKIVVLVVLVLVALFFLVCSVYRFFARKYNSSLKHFLYRLERYQETHEPDEYEDTWDFDDQVSETKPHFPQLLGRTDQLEKTIYEIKKQFQNERLYSLEKLQIMLTHYRGLLDSTYGSTPYISATLSVAAFIFALFPNEWKVNAEPGLSIFSLIILVTAFGAIRNHRKTHYSLLVIVSLIEEELKRRKG